MPGYITCGPNQALVVSGMCYTKPHLVPGGRIYVWPIIQRAQKINLNIMTLIIESRKVYTKQGVPVSVTGIAQVKIQGQNEEMLRTACEQFLGKTDKQIMFIARETLEGHQRAIMGSMTVEEIYRDRKAFSKHVFDVASTDLINMGIAVISYTIKDLSDDEGYLKALGMGRTAEVQRDAHIGEAEAKRDAMIKESLALQDKMAARYLNQTEIIRAKRDYEVNKAGYNTEVNTKQADADLAYSLQAAKTGQRIKEEQMQILVVERTQKIQVQEQEILRKEKELEATVRLPADAEKYKLEKLAEANKNCVILAAEAEAEAIKLKGEAEAFAIEIKAKADAQQMQKKAEAFTEYKEAATLNMFIDILPQIVAEISAPFASCRKVTMVSVGQGQLGASKIAEEILDITAKVPEAVKKLTGVDITQAVLDLRRGSVPTSPS